MTFKTVSASDCRKRARHYRAMARNVHLGQNISQEQRDEWSRLATICKLAEQRIKDIDKRFP